jgi:hypothetical protein
LLGLTWLRLCDGLRRRRNGWLKDRTLSFITRLRLEQTSQSELVMLLLVYLAMFFGTKLAVTG